MKKWHCSVACRQLKHQQDEKNNIKLYIPKIFQHSFYIPTYQMMNKDVAGNIIKALFHMCKNSEFNEICRFFDFVCKIPALNFFCVERGSNKPKVADSTPAGGIVFIFVAF
uniref:Uncharacterized protein n=1 Tax=Strongyloides venezuelensis TaxID=75913 RepID=A0A0K0G5Y1_STRVS